MSSSHADKIAGAPISWGVCEVELPVLHPHVGTMIETRAHVQRVLDGSSISLCLDTGHLLIGGTDPIALARHAPERIATST